MKKTLSTLYWTVITVIVITAILLVTSVIEIPGGYRSYAVQSGSMHPKIKMGSVVVVRAQKEYFVGDVITYRDIDFPEKTITHRIIDIKRDDNLQYVTKGDANSVRDNNYITENDVIGKVFLSLPYLGYFVSFAKTQTGLIALVVIPATLIIYSELMTIKNEAIRLLRERKKRKLSLIENAEVAVGMEVMDVQDEIKSTEEKIERTLFKKKNNKKK